MKKYLQSSFEKSPVDKVLYNCQGIDMHYVQREKAHRDN